MYNTAGYVMFVRDLSYGNKITVTVLPNGKSTPTRVFNFKQQKFILYHSYNTIVLNRIE